MGAKAYIVALPHLLREQLIENAYRLYVTDALRFISMNTANFAGGSYPEERYYSLICDLVALRKVNTMTEDEVIAKVRKAWGGESD